MKLIDTVKATIKQDTPTEEVEEAARWLWDEFRFRKGRQDQMAAMEFRPGQKVEFTGKSSRKLPHGAIGVVEKVNTKSISVSFGRYLMWKVNATFLKPAAKDAKVIPFLAKEA